MEAESSLPKRPANVNLHHFLRTARWAVQTAWSTDAWLLAGLVVASLASSLTPAALALAARGLVNALVEMLSSGVSNVLLLLPWLVLGMGLTVLEAISRTASTYCSLRLKDEVNIRVTSDILEHASGLDVSFFEDLQGQDMLARAQRNTAYYFISFITDCLDIITNAIQIASLAGVLTAIDPLITLVLVPVALPYLFLQWRLAQKRYQKEYTQATKRRWMRYFISRITDQKWVPEVKLLGLAPLLIERFRALMTEFRDQDRRLYRYGLLANVSFVTLATVALYIVLARVADRVLGGTLTVGDVAVYAGAAARLRSTLQVLVTAIVAVREGMLYISTMDEFLQAEPRIPPASGLKSPPGGPIEFKHVTFTYPGSNQPALTDVSFCIKPGETVALVGENGAGKTTLVKLLARFYDPTDGCILVGGVDLQELSLAFWHSQIGFVFQDFGIYEASAHENIAYGDWRQLLQDRERVVRIARMANVHDMIEEMPQGYDTLLGRLFGEYTLSLGQWQRLAIARAFAREDSSLLILDEPTSSLDARAEYELFCRFRELAAGRTTVLISHRFSTVSIADRILVFDEGRIVEQGTHQTLLAQGGLYATLYRLHERQMVAA